MSKPLSCISIVLGLLAGLGSPAHAVSYLKFHIPQSETFARHINNANVVVGYFSESGVDQAFIRAADGAMTTFNVDGQNTGALDINTSGSIVGFFGDGSTVAHGFVRSPDGSVVSFDVPGATATVPTNMNESGVITGDYSTPDIRFGAFIRNSDGSIVTFDAGPHDGTIPFGIAADSTVAGIYYDGTHHGFVRKPDGSIEIFDPPGSTDTSVAGINEKGEIVGGFFNKQSKAFIRKTDGSFTFFNVGKGMTEPTAINNNSVVTGLYVDRRNVWHGFLRYPNGQSEIFDTGFGHVSAVAPSSINDQENVAGYLYITPKNNTARYRGFIRFAQ
jgi:uncharacterized membrane protein